LHGLAALCGAVALIDSVNQCSTAINQGLSESVSNCHKRFLAAAEVVEAQWGQFHPLKLTSGTGSVDKKTARDNERTRRCVELCLKNSTTHA